MKSKMERVSRIHDDHRVMVQALELLSAPTPSGNEHLVSDVIDHLTTHFIDEESCMRVYGYPHMKLHELAHEAIQEELAKMLCKMTPIEHQQAELEKLKHIILDHILLDDERFMEYLKEKD